MSSSVVISPNRRLLHSFPIFLSQLLSMSWGFMDTAMLAVFSNQDLAALAIAGSFYMVLSVSGKGFLQALAPMAAHLFGRHEFIKIGSMTRQAVYVALVLAAIGVAVLLSPTYLDWATLEPLVHDKARSYLYVISFGLLAVFLMRVMSALAQAVGKPQRYTQLLLIGLGLKFGLNYALVFGFAGHAALGVVGCAAATALTNWILCVIGAVYLWRASEFRTFAFFKREWPNWREQWALFRFGLPFGVGYWLEVAVFSAIAVSMSKLGTDALAANQIVSNFANLLFTIPLSISLAVAVQMGHLLGEGKPAESYRVGMFALKISAILALVLSGVAWLIPSVLVGLYHPAPELMPMIASIMGFLVIYHLCDATQSVASFLCRAHQNAWWPAVAYAVCMWVVALNLGHFLAYGSGNSPALIPDLAGFYVGQIAGLGLAGLMMFGFWRLVLAKRSVSLVVA